MLQKLLPKQKVSMSSDVLSNYEQLGTNLSVKDTNTLQQMGQVMSVLSKYDALSIFVLAKNGLKSELDTPQKIGLTKKQYYTRLKQLYDLKLITKNDNVYVHTTFGNIVYEKHLVGLVNNIVNIKELEMIDVLKRSSKFDPKEISSFLAKIGLDDKIVQTSKQPTMIISNYDDMVSKALEMIEFAQSEVLLGTRFLNELIINANLKKARSGVPVKVLADVSLVNEYFEREKSFKKEDKNKNERINVVSNPYYPSNIERRYTNVPFSTLIVDGKQVGIEIIDNYNTLKFNMALYVTDESLAGAMKSHFENLWQYASANPAQIIEKKV